MTVDGIALLHDTIKNNISKCQVLISGSWKDVSIQKFDKTSTSIKVFVYLDEDAIGTITKYRLVMNDGKVFDERSDSVTKDNSRGLLVLFEYNIKEG